MQMDMSKFLVDAYFVEHEHAAKYMMGSSDPESLRLCDAIKDFGKYGGESLRINIDGIRETNEGLKKEVAGHIGRVLDERLVLTDPELSEILKERDDEKRAKSFRAFVLRVRNEAIVSLQDQIRTATTAQSDVVREEIQNRLEEVNHRMDEVQHAYEDIIKAKNGRSSELEEKRMQYMYTYTLYQTISDELKGEG